MRTVEYYTARPLRQEEIHRDYTSRTVLTTYTDVNPHMGNICLFCAHESQKKNRAAGLAVLIGGSVVSSIAMLVGLVRSTIAQNNGANVGAALGLPMTLMCVFLIVAVIGLSIFLGSNTFNPNRRYTRDQLCPLFIKYLYQENNPSGIVYLSPWQVKQMKRK